MTSLIRKKTVVANSNYLVLYDKNKKYKNSHIVVENIIKDNKNKIDKKIKKFIKNEKKLEIFGLERIVKTFKISSFTNKFVEEQAQRYNLSFSFVYSIITSFVKNKHFKIILQNDTNIIEKENVVKQNTQKKDDVFDVQVYDIENENNGYFIKKQDVFEVQVSKTDYLTNCTVTEKDKIENLNLLNVKKKYYDKKDLLMSFENFVEMNIVQQEKNDVLKETFIKDIVKTIKNKTFSREEMITSLELVSNKTLIDLNNNFVFTIVNNKERTLLQYLFSRLSLSQIAFLLNIFIRTTMPLQTWKFLLQEDILSSKVLNIVVNDMKIKNTTIMEKLENKSPKDVYLFNLHSLFYKKDKEAYNFVKKNIYKFIKNSLKNKNFKRIENFIEEELMLLFSEKSFGDILKQIIK